MEVFFRVDASKEIGSGHVMRCLTLANLLKEHGSNVRFICRETTGNMIPLIKEHQFQVISIPNKWIGQEYDAKEVIAAVDSLDVDWLIVDHYQIDITWERKLKPYVKKIFVIDDLADRLHDCDVLLNQNYYPKMRESYEQLTPEKSILLLGPEYLLLRNEFYGIKPRKIEKLQHLLLFFGGSDPTNETSKVLHALIELSLSQLDVTVVVGESNPNKEEVERLAFQCGASYYCQINHMSSLMAEADLSLGAGGTAMWERCYIGLPSFVTVVADNQWNSSNAAAKYGAVKLLGWHEDLTIATYKQAIERAAVGKDDLMEMQAKGLQLMGENRNRTSHPVLQIIRQPC